MQANKEQKKAIEWNTGPALILAGPGSGKTFTTVERVKYLIEVHHADPSHILVITFTKAAARQMREDGRKALSGQFRHISRHIFTHFKNFPRLSFREYPAGKGKKRIPSHSPFGYERGFSNGKGVGGRTPCTDWLY